VLADNESLIMAHPVVIYFMTMLVGAGGNAGNQAAVRIIRGLATGEVQAAPTPGTKRIVSDEIVRAFLLASIIVAAGFVRVVLFDGTIVDAVAISASLFIIVSSSVILGTLLPLLLSKLGFDAAHASTSIQVIMDVTGVLITCSVAPIVFQAAETYGLLGA
jgi:Mg/Co/Ni transporter MgtE